MKNLLRGQISLATANFGATALTYTPPVGFAAGLCDVAPCTASAGATSINSRINNGSVKLNGGALNIR